MFHKNEPKIKYKSEKNKIFHPPTGWELLFQTIVCFQLCGNILWKILSCFNTTKPLRTNDVNRKCFPESGVEDLNWPEPRPQPHPAPLG